MKCASLRDRALFGSPCKPHRTRKRFRPMRVTIPSRKACRGRRRSHIGPARSALHAGAPLRAPIGAAADQRHFSVRAVARIAKSLTHGGRG
jgi:hypothetical protein